MDKIWAPWRMKYITNIDKDKDGCVFCDILKSSQDEKNYIITRGKHCFIVLNLYPYNNGHILIVINRHVDDICLLEKAERDEMMDYLQIMKNIMQETLSPQGFNVGINFGRAAGAGIPDHLHMHIVPRWTGDVNFMPVIGDTKVISQSLEGVYKIFYDAYKKRH